jgi:hypothetical protein
MDTHKRTARIVGALFLIAMVTSLVGGIWLESLITAPDYLVTVSANRAQVIIGVLLELINGFCVIGIAVGFFPLFRKHSESLALGYVALRIVEAAVIVAAVISPLALITLSQEFARMGAADASSFQAIGTSFLAVRESLAGQMLGIVFCLAALVLYYLLYQTKLVPRFISIWGFLAVLLVLVWNLLELFGISVAIGMVLALPMILNEIFLALWLIVKGFEPSAVAAGSAE